jgi:hypothetical protein
MRRGKRNVNINLCPIYKNVQKHNSISCLNVNVNVYEIFYCFYT